MLYTALCTFNAMLQCLTQLIIGQTSIIFQLCQQQHQITALATLFLQITRHFGGSVHCVHMLELSLCCVPIMCTAITGHWYNVQPHELTSLMQGVAGASLVPAAPVSLTLTSAHPRQCTKQIPTRHKGQKYLFTVNTFFRCTMSVLNVQYLWHRIVHVVSKVSLDTGVNIQVILLHKVSHLCHKHFNLLIIIIRIEHVFTIFTCWDNHNRAHKSFPYHQKSRPFCWVEIKMWFDQFSVVHSPCFQARSSRPNFGCQEHLSRQIQFGNKEMRKMLMNYIKPINTLSHFNSLISWQRKVSPDDVHDKLIWNEAEERGDWSGVTPEWPHQNQSSHQNMITVLALSPPSG